MNVLIIGSGGREHSFALKLNESKHLNQLFAIPGNPGISKIAKCEKVDINNNEKVVTFAKENNIGLVVIGPENPLANGLTDALENEGIRVFGPNKSAARFEASKGFARNFMKKYNLPSPEFAEFSDFEEAKKYIEEKGAPIVIKADGLAAGKGVFVSPTVEEAIEFTNGCLLDNKFGSASSRVVIEECMFGEEGSYLVFLDSNTYKPMPYSQDHKPIFNGDKGPNTGGMGAYSPAPILDGHEKELDEKIMQPFIKGIKAEGIDYKGVLYVGLMKTKDGLKIVEFNCRFGDPETQVILPRLESDLIEVFNAVIDRKLEQTEIKWKNNHCVSLVISSKGYPGKYETGTPINGLEDATEAQVIHAGTKEEDGIIKTNGGRVLNIVTTGDTLLEAIDLAYSQIKKVDFEGMFYRTDIGKKELDRQNVKRKDS
jgi:phosphoribosylamine--glycine ligase